MKSYEKIRKNAISIMYVYRNLQPFVKIDNTIAQDFFIPHNPKVVGSNPASATKY